MYKLLLSVLVILLTACANQNSTTAPVNIVIAIQDDGAGSIAHTNNAVVRLANNLSGELSAGGANVYDLGAEFDYSGPRNRAMLMDMARSYQRAPIDYIVLLSATSLTRSLDHTTQITGRVSSETVNVNTGRYLGSYASQGSKINVSPSCRNSCINDTLSRSLNTTVGELASAILSALPSRQASQPPSHPISGSSEFALIFDGFTPQNMSDIEEYLVIFSGYEGMRLVNNRHTYTEISYNASISRSKLSRNLYRTLHELGINGTVSITGNTVRVNKTTTRQNQSQFDLEGW